ncbi:MAG: endonuclease MutS2 [Peptoniphilaceae bacterium]|nr:endonuclease MutS2 [Peptoniphilaceae bacterium]MDY6085947.1 endonuclease MutS2 [Peptoniphilaceae bacterium]
MDERVLQTLEYDQILDQLASYASSPLTVETIRKLRPSSDRRWIEQRQAETADALRLVLDVGKPPLFGIHPVRAALRRAKLGGVLSMRELLHISEVLRQTEALQEYAQDVDEGVLVMAIRALFVQSGLRRQIADAILDEETMADTASRELYSIRQSMRAKQDQVKTKLNEILARAAQAGYLSEGFVTMRDGRYVLPVKASNKSNVRGVVHDASGSGQTVFIEPMAVVELNNEIRALEAEEEVEMQRILAALSMEVSEFEREIGDAERMLVALDVAFAKGKYALKLNAITPEFTEDRVVDLHQARHPLLGKHVVPIDIRLGEDFNTLIITGPNTGGKTVSLKTLGLLQAMAQAGLAVPCQAPSKMAVFSSLYADIGDRQSIEQSLSTFSASMKNLVEILEQADEGSLLLLDELGSGTDPTEGAALAMAILERVTRDDIRTVATTHYAELKLFAIREKGVQNASVEFDVETLSPTYRLTIGLPGRSNAFEISKRLGLSEEILEAAESYVDQGSVAFETVLADIERSRRETEEEREAMRREREAYRERLSVMQKELEKAKSAYEQQMTAAREEAEQVIREARDSAKEMIRKAKEAQDETRPQLDRTLSEINDEAKKYEKKHAKKVRMATDRKGPTDLKPGERVKILSLDQTGILVSEPDRDGRVEVQMGLLKVRSNVRDLARVSEETIAVPKPAHSSVQTSGVTQKKAQVLLPQLDLRGFRFDEAMDRVDKYLDDSVMAGYSKVRIIHGKGTGALRKGIHDRLKKDRRVDSFAFADAREGGTGATDIVLK